MHESSIIKDIYCFVLEMTITRNRESQTLNKQCRLRMGIL